MKGISAKGEGNLKALEKSTAGKLREAKQRESHTDHQYNCPQTPEPGMLGQGLSGTETQALEVS